MQRQKSILSFLQKPSSENPSSGSSSYTEILQRRRLAQFLPKQLKQNPSIAAESVAPTASDLPPEVLGTETPPEKPRGRVLPSRCSADGDAGARTLSSIMQKLSKEDEHESSPDRNQHKGAFVSYSYSNKLDDSQGLQKQRTSFQHLSKDNVSIVDGSYDQVSSLNIESIPDVLEPETPAMRPLVPRLKRIQEDAHNFGDKRDTYFLDSSKRMKLLQDSGTKNKINGVVCETTGSKFEWLDPSLIRDAAGRRPGDALYNKRTLYIPPDALKKMSASQKQYWTVKCQYMDVVLFFKVGKFYELYELDAEIGHKELDWKMTNSGVGKCRQVGISESGIDDAVQKLIARGYKVGRMEQIETSDKAKARGATAVIQRKLVHVFTPSTTTEWNMGPDAVHLLALKEGHCDLENRSTEYGFAFLDYAALKFWVGSMCNDASCATLGALLMQVSPKELVYESKGLSSEAHKALKKYASAGSALQLSPVLPGTVFADASEVRKLIESKGYFKGSSDSRASGLDSVMVSDLAICALGGLVDHLSRLMLDDALRNGEILPYQVYSSCLRMDGQTLVNLEIFSNNVDGAASGTLYRHLDSCITSAGKRLLRNWICHPLKNIGEINDRLNVVEGLMKQSEITFIIAQYLRRLPDLERLLGRVKASVGSSAVLSLPLIGEKVLKQQVKAFGTLVKGLRIGMELLVILQKEDYGISSLSKVLNLPLLSELDDVLTQFETAVDDSFPQYQEHDIKDSDAETLSILVELFVEKSSQWTQIIHALSRVDVLRSFAVIANSSRGCMCRPVLVPPNSTSVLSIQETGGSILKVKGLWHPYAIGENGGDPVPNDIYLGEGTAGYCPRTLLLTGPNMGGKSTLLRATCLAVIMAQLGCYVPCEMCVLSPVDIVFTRLGATDRIMTGESTFFIECSETASILQNATQDSLVLLDELGRGTSTFDGYAIAYAVFRHLIEKVQCRLLFATHYHPLTKEFASHPHVSLQHMACAFNQRNGSSSMGNQELVFLYKLTSGACPESYGLQVALMAGIPKWVVEAASKASGAMRRSIGENFKSSEGRSEFSTLHEEWLKTILAVSRINGCDLDEDDSDTLLLLWHELKNCYRLLKGKE
ncbi:DNA mismatch repair protein MSH7 [Magnolia sinica]|uniref:DNA mismatch repair protein MSH7 n=1 Tax=Magnolia sinica TaxID=86752 RepID=UPI002659A383|nr:DNA mismatch repair protein MSH7 [Magnolia sinica]